MAGLTNHRTYDAPIKIGVSSCLLGEKVRFDGGHKKDSFLTDLFGRYVQWVPVCPEVEVGMPTPREPIRLALRDGSVHLVAPKSGTDHTHAMESYSVRRAGELGSENLCGYVFKKDSPSCGVWRVRVYNEEGMPERNERGLFARALIEAWPQLPVEEEGRLSDPKLRENFIERVFAYDRLRRLFDSNWSIGDLVAFHTAHKLTLMAHSLEHYKSLGRLVAVSKKVDRGELRSIYQREFMGAMERLATTKQHAGVLQHMHGHVSDKLDHDGRRELLGLIEDYRLGLVPLIVPVTLLRHYIRRFGIDYLEGQVYLDPHPKELMLRNRV
ncbi:MAG: YbgA family protein [Actinomycetota bacterium]